MRTNGQRRDISRALELRDDLRDIDESRQDFDAVIGAFEKMEEAFRDLEADLEARIQGDQ